MLYLILPALLLGVRLFGLTLLPIPFYREGIIVVYLLLASLFVFRQLKSTKDSKRVAVSLFLFFSGAYCVFTGVLVPYLLSARFYAELSGYRSLFTAFMADWIMITLFFACIQLQYPEVWAKTPPFRRSAFCYFPASSVLLILFGVLSLMGAGAGIFSGFSEPYFLLLFLADLVLLAEGFIALRRFRTYLCNNHIFHRL